jgi:hypothetical protein
MATATTLTWVLSPLVVYLLFFLLAQRPTAVRCSRIGQLIVLLTSSTSLVMDFDNQASWLLSISFLVVGICLWSLSRISLVRLTTDQYQALIQTGSARLLLTCETTRSRHLVLTDRTRTASIHLYPIAPRILVAVTPPAHIQDKITLLVQWLPKVLPGPLPRLRIALKKNNAP